ncbi:4Fe-4S dicluster domain-containing protein [Marinifilum sp. JC120]|nr:4Fe-4S dicluster domain-containing protein [Marinifilum sp. JC120]
MKRIYPDRDMCIGCGLCVLGCLAAHSKSHDLVLAYKEERAKGLVSRKRLIEADEVCVAISCRHCEEPECVPVCISGALSKDEKTGITVYDADKCVGCWTCIMACPYGAIQRDKYNNKIIKCDLCAGRESGPACVEACSNRALKYEERQS